MLKKFLTTIIVLAATATAWADGYGYTLDKDGARATITTGEQTLEEVITAIKGLTPTVQYVILPDGMTKEEVNSIATANGFVVAVSKNEATTTETKWVYTYNEEEFIYEGTPTTIDGVSKANVTVFVPLTVTESSYKLGDNDYNRTVFYDSDGNCYGVNNESDIFNLTTNGKGYTYNNGATEYTGKVAESEGKYYGVINNPTEVALELNKPVSWTYNLNYDYSITYAHFGEVYNYYGNNIFWQGGTEYDLTTETRYTYDEYGQKKLYTGATRTADGITYGNTGTSFNVSYVNAYTYNDNGIIKVYTGATRTDADGKTYGNTGSGEVTLTSKQAYTYNDNGIKVYTGPVRTTVVDGKTQYYGNTGEMFSLTTTKNAPRTYDSGKYIYEGEYISGANGNVGGTFYELIKFTATAENPVYTYIDYGTWPHTLYLYLASDVDENGKVNGQETTKNTSGDFYYYTKDNKKYQYNSDIYTKLDGTGQYACEGGTVVNNVEQATENVKYYTDTDNKKVVYTGNVYTDNDDKEYGVKDIYSDKDLTYGTVYYNGDVLFTGNVYDKTTNEGTVKVGYTTNPYEIPLEKKNVYVKDDNITVYSGNVYTKDDKSVGFENGAEKELTLGEVKVYNKDGQILIATDNSRISLDGDTYCEGGTQIGLTKEEGTANLYTDGEGRSVIYTGKVYGDATGYIGGTETELAYGDIYKKEDGTIYTGYRNEDNTKGCNNPQKLTTLFTYEYENPNNKEETVTFTDTQHLTTKEVDYTATVEQKEIEVPTGKIHLIAYVSTPGSLVDGISDWAEVTGTGYYNAGNVTALTLSGTVNAKDIYCSGDYVDQYGNACFYENGKIKWNKTDSQAIGFGEPVALKHAFVTYIDLEDAVFPVQTDMQFGYVNTKLETVILPTHKSMTLIPDHAFDNLHYVSELCIPYNYTTIGSCAFFNTHALMHIYTTDNPEDDSDDETIVDNGPYTYTFSANLKQIEGGIGVNSTFFGDNIEAVTDIYVLAEKAPLCGANAFAGSMTYGNNGFAGNWTHPICRENYINSNKWICVLHYPSSSTDEQAAKYTDITRNYTLIDEVGNVDGDGRPIAWPRHAEFYRAYNQAINGYIWYDWKEYDEGATEVIQIYDASKVSANPTKYDQAYQGWHEFVLVGNSRSRDFDPQKENREYIQRDWYTICVPYDLTKSQLLNMLGVVNSEAEETVYALKENEGKWEVSETGTTITQNLYPDVRALTHVSRYINENGTYVSGKVTLHLSEPLISVDENGNVTCSHVDINEDGQGYTHATLEGDDPIVMEGGHAYLIRPYVPKEWNDQIKNLGMYIMAMADSYNNTAVSAGLPAPYSYNEDCKFENKVYLPCFKHKIHAVKGNGSPNASARNIPEFVYEDAEGQSPAYYRFVGTYTQTTVPQYAYYLGKNKTAGAHQFFRTTKETTKWNPYSAVIVGLSSNPNYTGVDTSGQTGIQSVGFVSDNENDLRALAGEVTNPSNAGKSLSFEQLMGDANGEATGIVDVNVNSNVNVSNNKVYSINGQYMGTSLNKLPKGIYIINGQKKVVK